MGLILNLENNILVYVLEIFEGNCYIEIFVNFLNIFGIWMKVGL